MRCSNPDLGAGRRASPGARAAPRPRSHRPLGPGAPGRPVAVAGGPARSAAADRLDLVGPPAGRARPPLRRPGARRRRSAPAEPSVGEVSDASATVVVSVVGAVVRPGLVTLPSGSRVAAAVEAAGGVSPGGDPGSVNLAAVITDGQQIVVGAPGAAALRRRAADPPPPARCGRPAEPQHRDRRRTRRPPGGRPRSRATHRGPPDAGPVHQRRPVGRCPGHRPGPAPRSSPSWCRCDPAGPAFGAPLAVDLGRSAAGPGRRHRLGRLRCWRRTCPRSPRGVRRGRDGPGRRRHRGAEVAGRRRGGRGPGRSRGARGHGAHGGRPRGGPGDLAAAAARRVGQFGGRRPAPGWGRAPATRRRAAEVHRRRDRHEAGRRATDPPARRPRSCCSRRAPSGRDLLPGEQVSARVGVSAAATRGRRGRRARRPGATHSHRDGGRLQRAAGVVAGGARCLGGAGARCTPRRPAAGTGRRRHPLHGPDARRGLQTGRPDAPDRRFRRERRHRADRRALAAAAAGGRPPGAGARGRSRARRLRRPRPAQPQRRPGGRDGRGGPGRSGIRTVAGRRARAGRRRRACCCCTIPGSPAMPASRCRSWRPPPSSCSPRAGRVGCANGAGRWCSPRRCR